LLSGQLEHKNSTGTNAVLKPGDVGWLTAGRGITHAQRLSGASLAQHEGAPARTSQLHALQLWVNLPARLKLMEPSYQLFRSESIPLRQQQGAQLRIIAGQYGEQTGPAPTHTPMLLAHGRITSAENAFIALPETFSLAVYVVQGSLLDAGGATIDEGELAIWHTSGAGIHIGAEQNSHFLILAGEPIQEPLATYGTFAMNYPDELLQAIDDYKAGRMGRL
jgi:redox-sensitive bicupin YhaK (pirin superfamily)